MSATVLAAGAAVVGTVLPMAAYWSAHRNPSSATSRNTAANQAAGASASAPPQVKQMWQPGMRQFGIDIYWENNPTDPDQVVRAKAQRTLDYVTSLGANSVSVSFPFVMDSAHASSVQVDSRMTPSPARFAIVLEEANKRKLRTSIRPLLDERNLKKATPNVWRGTITPANKAAWLASYRNILLPYGTVAEAAHVATFIVGAELTSMERADGWQAVVQGLQAVYHGELQYDANYDQLAGPGPGGTVRAVDAYSPLQLPDTATVSQLAAGWDRWLNHGLGPGTHPDLLLAEVAISAHTGSYKQPWAFGSGPILPEIQQNWFDAACQVMRERNLAGIYFWMINMDTDLTAAPPDSEPMYFVGRPGEQNVRACFATSTRQSS